MTQELNQTPFYVGPSLRTLITQKENDMEYKLNNRQKEFAIVFEGQILPMTPKIYNFLTQTHVNVSANRDRESKLCKDWVRSEMCGTRIWM